MGPSSQILSRLPSKKVNNEQNKAWRDDFLKSTKIPVKTKPSTIYTSSLSSYVILLLQLSDGPAPPQLKAGMALPQHQQQFLVAVLLCYW